MGELETCKFNNIPGARQDEVSMGERYLTGPSKAPKPILFNTEMVKAILDGRKTMTRRIANINTDIPCNDVTKEHEFAMDSFGDEKPTGFVCSRCGFGVAPPHSRFPCGTSLFRPRYWSGDILYVRETWGNYSYDDPESNAAYFMYRADFPDDAKGYWYEHEHIHFCNFPRWRPSIHMPKEAARIFIRVKSVRLERLHSITADDAMNEGFTDWNEFVSLWNSTVKPAYLPFYGWDANPLVWVYEFERCDKPKGE